MQNPNRLYIRMLGGCSLTVGERTIDMQSIRSKKFWSFLEYIITFRDREISQNELIDLFYPEGKSENPLGALKTLIHRIRNTLGELGLPDSRQLIIQSRGTYRWNSRIDSMVDVDEFEGLVKQGRTEADEERRIELYLRAIEQYRGDFLPNSALDSWAVPLNTYYHNMFIEMLHELNDMLRRRKRYSDIVRICRYGLTIDAYDEPLYYHLILALSDIGNYQAAMAQYKEMNNLFYSEFGITPSKELIALYREIVKDGNAEEKDIAAVKAELRESDLQDGAYMCEYEVFKDIYRLESRAVARTGQPIHLCLFTISYNGYDETGRATMQDAMKRLLDCIRVSLRRGDIYARYSVSQFIVMMPLTYENGVMVSSRIAKRFKRENPRLPFEVGYALQPIDVSI